MKAERSRLFAENQRTAHARRLIPEFAFRQRIHEDSMARIDCPFRPSRLYASILPMAATNDPSESALESPREFATTHWSIVLLAGGAASPGADQALEHLCQSYWYPLYAYVRRQGHTSTDAQDLTQDFFARFLEREYFKLADPNRGRFRTPRPGSCSHRPSS